MEWLVNGDEMKTCDKNTIEHYGVPSLVLMERAALETVAVIAERGWDKESVLVVCGTGNNGGDGFAIARLLMQRGARVHIFLMGDKSKLTKDASIQYEICRKYQIPFHASMDFTQQNYGLVIDALFGIGLSRELSGNYKKLIDNLNELPAHKLAVDVPSGISADTGNVMGAAFAADVTVTFAYRKIGLVRYPGRAYAGEVITADIGIDAHSFLGIEPTVCAVEEADVKRLLERRADGNKGTFGKVLVVAGSVNMAGAAYFAAKAAYRSGCGLVRIYTSEENRQILQTKLPEAILTTYDDSDFSMDKFLEVLAWADAVVIGPGLGLLDTARKLVEHTIKTAKIPVVADADALNLIAKDTAQCLAKHGELILTPHMGEMARLCNMTVEELKTHGIAAAEEFAGRHQVICVMKDACTVTALPQGETYLNQTGNDGMATGGSGDVLAGVIGGLLAQGICAKDAVPAGVWLHGRAGDLAAKQLGTRAVMASDIIEHL